MVLIDDENTQRSDGEPISEMILHALNVLIATEWYYVNRKLTSGNSLITLLCGSTAIRDEILAKMLNKI